jgi:hypothetical protein
MWESHIIMSSPDSASLIALLSADRLDVVRDLKFRADAG